jgi:hypothetical protein
MHSNLKYMYFLNVFFLILHISLSVTFTDSRCKCRSGTITIYLYHSMCDLSDLNSVQVICWKQAEFTLIRFIFLSSAISHHR